MSKLFRDIDISAIKKHLIYSGCYNGVDLQYYEYVLNRAKEDKLIYSTDLELAKIERVFSVLSDMKNKNKTVFKPLIFKTQCCSVNVEFNNNVRPVYSCPECKSWVTAHNDFMPMGTLAHKKIRKLRSQLHSCFDNVCDKNTISRRNMYFLIANKLEKNPVDVHIGNVNCINDAVDYFHAIQWVKSELTHN